MKKLLFVLVLTSLDAAQQWAPKPLTTWNYQIGETPTDLAIQVQAYDIDGFDNEAEQVQKIYASKASLRKHPIQNNPGKAGLKPPPYSRLTSVPSACRFGERTISSTMIRNSLSAI